MNYLTKMDDLGASLFQETTMCFFPSKPYLHRIPIFCPRVQAAETLLSNPPGNRWQSFWCGLLESDIGYVSGLWLRLPLVGHSASLFPCFSVSWPRFKSWVDRKWSCRKQLIETGVHHLVPYNFPLEVGSFKTLVGVHLFFLLRWLLPLISDFGCSHVGFFTAHIESRQQRGISLIA